MTCKLSGLGFCVTHKSRARQAATRECNRRAAVSDTIVSYLAVVESVVLYIVHSMLPTTSNGFASSCILDDHPKFPTQYRSTVSAGWPCIYECRNNISGRLELNEYAYHNLPKLEACNHHKRPDPPQWHPRRLHSLLSGVRYHQARHPARYTRHLPSIQLQEVQGREDRRCFLFPRARGDKGRVSAACGASVACVADMPDSRPVVQHRQSYFKSAADGVMPVCIAYRRAEWTLDSPFSTHAVLSWSKCFLHKLPIHSLQGY